ncbi:MAG: zinc ABC transporter solute-binding protein [Rhizobiales bacterium]|nr:zinc ABC transporter solute-binding protein [Hyphomicrobiales bacterium]
MHPFIVAAGSAILGAVTFGSVASADEPPKAVTTIGMIADVAANVAGECVAVEAVMGPGVDPHLYQASAGDVRALQQADAILYSGYSLEGQLGEVLAKLGERKPTVAVSPAAIDPGDLITVQDIYGIDPHLWMDASLWARTAPVIALTFAEIAPDCADDMQTRTEIYGEQLQALHGWIKASIESIPEAQRILITAHDAFNYYGRAYGIDVTGVQGISTESEAGIADIREMVDTVVARKVPAVFIESTINPRTIQAVIDAAADKGQAIEIGGELYSDAMGEPGTAGGTYIGMLVENTLTIVRALGGKPAALPDALQDWATTWSVDIAEN